MPVCNGAIGGIYIDTVTNDVVVNNNGFTLVLDGTVYYIAPVDGETETRFTFESGSTNILVVNVDKITRNVRTNPSDCMEIITQANAHKYTGFSIPVAVCYKDLDVWHFVGAFRYFSDYSASARRQSSLNVSEEFTKNNLVAHMGGHTQEQNTIANFEDAIADGYKILEMDVRETSDNVLVLSHDGSFTVGGVTYTISQETYATLVAVKPNLATLHEAMLLCKKNNVVAELDFTHVGTQTANTNIVAEVQRMGMAGRSYITCTGAIARQLLNIDNDLCICVSNVTTNEGVDSVADIRNTAAVAMCSVEYTSVTQPLVYYMHEKGFLVKPWTVNTLSDVQQMFNYGCDFVISDLIKPSDL
jgi:glycerophosphoryl diester phosphodiesterase